MVMRIQSIKVTGKNVSKQGSGWRLGSQVGVVVLSSSFTSGGPGLSPAQSTSGLGFQSLPDSVGFTQNITSGVFLPPLKLYLLLIIFPYRFL